MAIAESIVGIAAEHANGRRVTRVYLKVGHLRQVVPSALTFGFGLIAQGTPSEGAELEIEQIPAAGKCRTCGTSSRLDGFPLQCRGCGSLDLEVLEGEELYVESLEMEERPEQEKPTS